MKKLVQLIDRMVRVLEALEGVPMARATRRLESVADQLEQHVVRRVNELDKRQRATGSVLVLGQCKATYCEKQDGQREYIGTKRFSGKTGESEVDTLQLDMALKGPLWIVAVGDIELTECALGIEVQHVTKSLSGPVCLIDSDWELGHLLRLGVRFL